MKLTKIYKYKANAPVQCFRLFQITSMRAKAGT